MGFFIVLDCSLKAEDKLQKGTKTEDFLAECKDQRAMIHCVLICPKYLVLQYAELN